MTDNIELPDDVQIDYFKNEIVPLLKAKFYEDSEDIAKKFNVPVNLYNNYSACGTYSGYEYFLCDYDKKNNLGNSSRYNNSEPEIISHIFVSIKLKKKYLNFAYMHILLSLEN